MVESVQKTPAQIADERLRELADKLWNDKTLGPQVQKFAKNLYPDAKTTDDVVEPWVGPLREQIEALAKQAEELRAERATEKKASEQHASEKSFREQLDKARKEYSLTDKGLDDLVARMKEVGAYDVDATAAWVARQAPPPVSPGPTWAPQHLDLFGSRNKDEAMAQLHNDPQGYMDSQLSEFVRNPDQYVQETFGRPN